MIRRSGGRMIVHPCSSYGGGGNSGHLEDLVETNYHEPKKEDVTDGMREDADQHGQIQALPALMLTAPANGFPAVSIW